MQLEPDSVRPRQERDGDPAEELVNYATDADGKRWMAVATDGARFFPENPWMAREG